MSGQPEEISLAEFTNSADQALSIAMDPHSSNESRQELAQGVVDRLAAVKVGKLAVHPPLSEAQVAHYRATADTIVAIGSSITEGLQQAEQGRTGIMERLKQGRQARRATKPNFSGTGSEAKR